MRLYSSNLIWTYTNPEKQVKIWVPSNRHWDSRHERETNQHFDRNADSRCWERNHTENMIYLYIHRNVCMILCIPYMHTYIRACMHACISVNYYNDITATWPGWQGKPVWLFSRREPTIVPTVTTFCLVIVSFLKRWIESLIPCSSNL